MSRDKQGRFTKGHKPTTYRDTKTGRYIRLKDMSYEDRELERIFDERFKERMNKTTEVKTTVKEQKPKRFRFFHRKIEIEKHPR